MSSPPVDPWSGQPEHDPHYDFHPPQPGHPVPPADAWSAPGGQPPYHGGWSAAPTSGPPPAQPYPTQPYPHQPYGGHPVTPQDGFPAGGYAGYPQPYPGGSHPGAGPARPRQLNLVLTLGLVGLLVLCLGGGAVGYVALSEQDSPGPTPGPTPTATGVSSPTPSGAPSSEAAPSPEPTSSPRIQVVTPETLAGRPKSTEPTLKKLADDMVRDLKSSVPQATGVVGAFYGSADERDMVMVVAASTFVLNPERELDDSVKGISKELAVKRLTTIAPGPNGGLAKCGDGESAGVPLGVCAWADHGSVGIIVMFFSSSAAAAAEFVAIRGQIEQKS
ncbi:hypothetical protein GA0070606_1614 [Micromonospora citrea]|uniref:Flagellar basal body-associated protein FliL n=1 Tax=Micromonospora citrea TaxID=47855 RepID=A0A1C6U8A6_9ACTN|nr:hypothetical protein [Micromonospora citrea]SCL50310.1 hypothetical protein GA0070606_1614 [Micromonospora citrea]